MNLSKVKTASLIVGKTTKPIPSVLRDKLAYPKKTSLGIASNNFVGYNNHSIINLVGFRISEIVK